MREVLVTSADKPMRLTGFNCHGHLPRQIRDHVITLNASVPTGGVASVDKAQMPVDFSDSKQHVAGALRMATLL